jgi:hypothetical protein
MADDNPDAYQDWSLKFFTDSRTSHHAFSAYDPPMPDGSIRHRFMVLTGQATGIGTSPPSSH